MFASQIETINLELGFENEKFLMAEYNELQVALKNNLGVYYFRVLIPIHILFSKFVCTQEEFNRVWDLKDIPQVVFKIECNNENISRFLNNNIIKVEGFEVILFFNFSYYIL